MQDPPLTSDRSGIRFAVRKAGPHECFIVGAPAGPGPQSALEVYNRIGRILADGNLQIVHERIFGSLSARAETLAARKEAMQNCGIAADGPVTYIEGCPAWGDGLAGVIIRAVSPECRVETITLDGSPCGRRWSRDGAEFAILQSVAPQSTADPAPAQTQSILTRADASLRSAGMTFADVQRTWFYLDDILAWYRPFNEARTSIYRDFGILPAIGSRNGHLPASTGISGRNPLGAVCALDVLAMRSAPGSRIETSRLANPLQNEATSYGSAFSRAVVIRQPGGSLIEVSGTAAIDTAGKSLHAGDVASQIDATLDSIEALIAQEKATLADISAATVFVKQPQYAAEFWKIAHRRKLDDLPCVCVTADICRPELLFELDAEVALT